MVLGPYVQVSVQDGVLQSVFLISVLLDFVPDPDSKIHYGGQLLPV